MCIAVFGYVWDNFINQSYIELTHFKIQVGHLFIYYLHGRFGLRVEYCSFACKKEIMITPTMTQKIMNLKIQFICQWAKFLQISAPLYIILFTL